MSQNRKDRPPRRRGKIRRLFNHLALGTAAGVICANILAEGYVWYNDNYTVTGGQDLTQNEVQLVRGIFGDAVDTSIVRKHFDQPCISHDARRAEACVAYGSDRHVFFVDPALFVKDYAGGGSLPRDVFMHEMTHIWQDQNYPTLYLAYVKSCKTYEYSLNDRSRFEDFCVEQQASIVANYVRYVLYPQSWPPGLYKGPEEVLRGMSANLARVVEDEFPQARLTRLRFEEAYKNGKENRYDSSRYDIPAPHP